jgi:rhomboid family GlyGly-CTERM serine protease
MTFQEIKTLLSQCKITLIAAAVLCGLNSGFIFNAAHSQWFQSFCAFAEYNREMILKGELWRLWTGHLVHWSPEHFYLDALVFVAQGVVFEHKIGRRYEQLLMIAAVVISMGLLIFQKDMTVYRGISGLINTQLVLGAGLFVFDRRLNHNIRAFYLSIFALHILKIAYETIYQAPFFSTDALGDMGRFTPLAHLGGVMAGLGGLISHCRKSQRRSALAQIIFDTQQVHNHLRRHFGIR